MAPNHPVSVGLCQLPLLLLLLTMMLAIPGSVAPQVPIARSKSLISFGTPGGLTEEVRLYLEDCNMDGGGLSCVFAIDSSVSQEPTQCAITPPLDYPYLVVWLETPSYVTKVTLLNMDRTFQSFPDALTNMVVKAADFTCVKYVSEESFVKRTFPCDTMTEYLSIESFRQAAVLAVCDIEVYGLPLTFPTVLEQDKQITAHTCIMTSVEGAAYCENAVDGETSGNHKQKACAVTAVEATPPVFTLILNEPAIVTEVKIFGRTDCCADGLTHFRLSIQGQTCSVIKEPKFEVAMFYCKHFGMVVKIESALSVPMSICEIQVFGHAVALHEPPPIKSLGCFKDKMKDHDLSQLVSSTRMSYKKCYTMCKRLGLKHFGVQNGVHCWCGSSFGKHGSVDNSTCATKCDGEPTDICGGPLLNSVFEILL